MNKENQIKLAVKCAHCEAVNMIEIGVQQSITNRSKPKPDLAENKPIPNDPPETNKAANWGPPGEDKVATLEAWIQTLLKMPEGSQPPGEIERARAELKQLIIKGDAA